MKGAKLQGVGLFGGLDVPKPAPKAPTMFQQVDALLLSKQWPQNAIRAFNTFLGAYCKHRGKPSMDDVNGWVAILERYREWKLDFDDIVYMLNWCRQSGRYYIALPPDMRGSGEYWLTKAQRGQQGGVKSGKAY